MIRTGQFDAFESRPVQVTRYRKSHTRLKTHAPKALHTVAESFIDKLNMCHGFAFML
jgi:hypothetical protein